MAKIIAENEALALEKMDLFATPDGWERIMDMIDSFPTDERIYVLTIAAMSWNLAVELHNQIVEDSDATLG